MKKYILLLISIFLIFGYTLTGQGVSIYQDGILPPNMTAAERDAVVSPETGLLVYVTDDNSFYFYNGTDWTPFTGSNGNWIVNGNNIHSSNSGNVGIGQPNPAQKLHVAGNVQGNNYYGNGSTLTFGNNTNMQPSLGISFIIALVGVFPSQNKGFDPYIGEVTMFAGNFPPAGWAFCEGQLLQISQNTALFSILGTTYGGDGEVTFALPDLRGRVPMHHGTGLGLTPRSIGEKVGAEKVGQ